jgi:hypothetical protein
MQYIGVPIFGKNIYPVVHRIFIYLFINFNNKLKLQQQNSVGGSPEVRNSLLPITAGPNVVLELLVEP